MWAVDDEQFSCEQTSDGQLTCEQLTAHRKIFPHNGHTLQGAPSIAHTSIAHPGVCSHENCSSSTAHILPRQLLTRSIAHSPTVHSVNCPPSQTSCNDNCSPSITQPQLPTDNCPSTIAHRQLLIRLLRTRQLLTQQGSP